MAIRPTGIKQACFCNLGRDLERGRRIVRDADQGQGKARPRFAVDDSSRPTELWSTYSVVVLGEPCQNLAISGVTYDTITTDGRGMARNVARNKLETVPKGSIIWTWANRGRT